METGLYCCLQETKYGAPRALSIIFSQFLSFSIVGIGNRWYAIASFVDQSSQLSSSLNMMQACRLGVSTSMRNSVVQGATTSLRKSGGTASIASRDLRRNVSIVGQRSRAFQQPGGCVFFSSLPDHTVVGMPGTRDR